MLTCFPPLRNLYDGEINPYFHEFTVLLQVTLTVVGSRLLVLRTPHTEKFRAKILALGLQVSECFDKIPVRILLDVLLRVFGFS